VRFPEAREVEQEARTRRRWLALHAEYYESTCPVCFAIPGMFCSDEEDGQEMYVVHRERLPKGVPFKIRARLVRTFDEPVPEQEETPCSGGS
jgi:hypothetical protein